MEVITPAVGCAGPTCSPFCHCPVQIHAKADFETLSEPILAPVTKVKWDFACRETFFATVSVEVFEHGLWGLIGDKRLVEKRTFDHAAFEFGEDLLKT